MNINGSQQSATLSNSTDWLPTAGWTIPAFRHESGVEFTYYRSPSDQLLNSRLLETTSLTSLQDCQRINRWKMFLAQEHSLGKGWGLNYGIVYTTGIDNSYQYYYDPETGEQLGNENTTSLAAGDNSAGNFTNMKSRKTGRNAEHLCSFSKSFGDKLSLDASLAVERYKTRLEPVKIGIPPSPELCTCPGHILQLALSSDRKTSDY